MTSLVEMDRISRGRVAWSEIWIWLPLAAFIIFLKCVVRVSSAESTGWSDDLIYGNNFDSNHLPRRLPQ